MERNAIVLTDGTDADVVALAVEHMEVGVQVFHVRDGRVAGERGWVADRTDDSDVPDLVEAFLLQLYADVVPSGASAEERRLAVPPEVLVPELPASGPVLGELLGELRGGRVRVRVPRRGPKRVLLDTVAQNAGQSLAQHKAKRASDLTTRNRALEELAQALALPAAPLRIECFDV